MTESDRLIAWLKDADKEKFIVICKMHLSFLLDLPGSSLEELLDDRQVTALSSEGKTVTNFTHKKLNKDLQTNSFVFGLPLTKKINERIYPLIEFLNMEENMRQEGLFRKTGHLGRQKCLRLKLDRTEENMKDELMKGFYTAHDCASILKTFLRELPEPLMTDQYYSILCQISENLNEMKRLEAVQLLIQLLPSDNNCLLSWLLQLLHDIAQEKRNLMTPETLGTIFAPHLMVPKRVTAVDLCSKVPIISELISFMINNTSTLFTLPQMLVCDVAKYWNETKSNPSLVVNVKSSGDDNRSVKMLNMRKRKSDETEINTIVSFTDRQASLNAAEEMDTSKALSQLFTHIANLPDTSKKRKLLKQCAKERIVSPSTTCGSNERHKRSKSVGDSLKRLLARKRNYSVHKTITTNNDFISSNHPPENAATKHVSSNRVHIVDAELHEYIETDSLSKLENYETPEKTSVKKSFSAVDDTPTMDSSSSPISCSLKKAPKSLQMCMMTPRSRVPMFLLQPQPSQP